MAQSESSRRLYNGSLASKAIGAGSKGRPPAGKAASTPTPMTPHGHTLQYLISIIKNSQQRSPVTIERRKDGDS
jgi:hypothetical protein